MLCIGFFFRVFFLSFAIIHLPPPVSSLLLPLSSPGVAQPDYFVASRSILKIAMAVSEQQQPRDCVTPLKTRGEIDVVRLEAALGHKQELKRNFGLWSLTSLGVIIAKYVN